MADLEKTINDLVEIEANMTFYKHPESAKVVRDAIELLKEQQPRVLKVTEFKESMPVWFEKKDGDIYCALIANCDGFDVRVLNNNKKYRFYFVDWLYDYYCIDWRCWSARPTDEQRKAVPWKDGDGE